MLYLIHVKGLAEHATPNARLHQKLAFVDLEKNCCKVLTFSNHHYSLFCLMYGECVMFPIAESCFGAVAFEHRREWQCNGACIYPRSVFNQIPCWHISKSTCHSTRTTTASVRISRKNYQCRVQSLLQYQAPRKFINTMACHSNESIKSWYFNPEETLTAYKASN